MSRLIASSVLIGLSLAMPRPAEACGGFFCSTEPIDQSKERIVFALDEQELQVEVHVQIFFQGDAEDFAWVVPVPGLPDVGLSTDALFQQLEWRTAPQWNLEWREEGDCTYGWYPPGDFSMEDGGPASAGGAPDEDGASDVVVVDQSQVGPYDQVTLQAETSGALLEWLQDNDYDIPDTVGAALAPYVTDGAYFVALKLSNDRDAGDITPLKMRYAGDAAMIPLVLTSIAATPDMRLQPYVFSDARAVPDNYLHVTINEAAVDWLRWGSNYDDVVTKAANEAGGQAFATDYSGSTDLLHGALYVEGMFDLDRLSTTTDPATFVDRMLGMGFPRTTTVQNLIRHFIPMPQEALDAGVEESWFYNCLDCYPEYLDDLDFQPVAFANTLDEVVVTPMRDAEDLFHRFSTVTRMTSSMSPEEMTVDPYFVLNRDMGEVSHQHHAVLLTDCGDGMDWGEAPRTLILDDGREILVPSERWMSEQGVTYGTMLEDSAPAAALLIEDTRSTGQPTLISDQRGLATDAIDGHNAWVRQVSGVHGGTAEPAGCGCNGGSSGAPALAALGLSLLALRRRED